MNELIERAAEEIEQHQKEVVRLRKYIEKLQSECRHSSKEQRAHGAYVRCNNCGKLM